EATTRLASSDADRLPASNEPEENTQLKPRKTPAKALSQQTSQSPLAPGSTRVEGTISLDGNSVKLTNLNKVYFPDEGFKKRDLVTYYHDMAPFVLPYLKDRPQSMNRHPNGIHGENFYQKDIEHHPAWVKTVRVRSESQDKEIQFLLCQDAATLVYM